jgi:hypothetical protein
MFDETMALVAGRFSRVEPRRTAREFVLGLLSGVERKNGWWLAERAGHATPDAMQRLLGSAVWDPRRSVTASAATCWPSSDIQTAR